MGPHETTGEQAATWNATAGGAWVEMQDVLDQALRPLGDLLVEAASTGSGGRVLDVGCGTGATTVAMARRLGADADCTGVDISEPMIAAARSRAEGAGVRARFIVGDAQRHRFEPASFDTIASRFGVMFFDDPVEAFANLRRATTDGGALRLIVWRSPDENPFMTAAERAAAPLITLPPRVPDEPGQFGMADGRRVRSILETSGWGAIDVQPIDVPCSFPERHLIAYFTRLGPAGRILAEMDPSTVARIVEVVRPAFDPYVHGDDVRFTSACWMVTAQA